jgi:hypothetical protein
MRIWIPLTILVLISALGSAQKPAAPCNAVETVQLARQCTEDGLRAWERYKSGGTATYVNPQFHFNPRLNTCLMFVSMLNVGVSKLAFFEVEDVYANKSLEAIFTSTPPDADGKTQEGLTSEQWNSKTTLGSSWRRLTG